MTPVDALASPHWDELWGTRARAPVGPRQRARLARLIRLIRRSVPAGSRILDLGCGGGELLAVLARFGFHLTGVDRSPGVVEYVKQRLGPSITVAVGDACDPPVGDGAFDLVIASELLEHLVDDDAAVSQVRRVLRPGGYLVASVPAHPDWWDASDDWAGHVRRYTIAELRSLCERHGLEVLMLHHWGFPLTWLYHRYLFLPRLKTLDSRTNHPPTLTTRVAHFCLTRVLACDRMFDGLKWGLGLILLARKYSEPDVTARDGEAGRDKTL